VNIFEEGVDNSLSVKEFDIEVTRSDKTERMMIIDRNRAFKEAHSKEAEEGLARLKQVAREGRNLFEVMRDIVEHCTVGQVTQAIFTGLTCFWNCIKIKTFLSLGGCHEMEYGVIVMNYLIG
jgi:methylmalonyl-CoA mutase N-terminal domain/subunit